MSTRVDRNYFIILCDRFSSHDVILLYPPFH
jgi:hypothetical protein